MPTMSKRLKVLCLMLPLSVLGCEHDGAPAPSGAAAVQQPAPEQEEPAGAELWAANCSRCHNIRPPQGFSAAQWQVIVHHMRLRANLTGNETRLITEFLQAGS
jgi:mono/diheme cytochrome c family protein